MYERKQQGKEITSKMTGKLKVKENRCWKVQYIYR